MTQVDPTSHPHQLPELSCSDHDLLSTETPLNPSAHATAEAAFSDAVPVPFESISEHYDTIVERYEESGYFVVQFDRKMAPDRCIDNFSKTFNFSDDLRNVLTPTPPEGIRISESFHSMSHQLPHTDGSRFGIRGTPTIGLFCEKPARKGGHTTLFHTTACFYLLCERKPWCAPSLFTHKAITRRRTAPGEGEAGNTGPAFLIDAVRGPLNRFATATPETRWSFQSIRHLKEAYRFFIEWMVPGSPFYKEIKLEAWQMIVVANNRICHGRTSFNDPSRIMHRSLWGNYLARRTHPSIQSTILSKTLCLASPTAAELQFDSG